MQSVPIMNTSGAFLMFGPKESGGNNKFGFCRGSTITFLGMLFLVTGTFDLGVPVDALFFIGSQLVATSHTGKIGVWNSMTQHWQV